MRFDEIEQLDEVPAGILGQVGKKLGAKALNLVPGGAAKSKAANLAAKADLGDTANLLHKEFNAYLGRNDKNMAKATGEDLVAFLKSKNHTTKATIPSGVLQKKQLDAVLMQAAKEAMAGQGAPAANAGSQGGAGGAAGAQGAAGKDGAPGKDGAQGAAGQDAAGADGGAAKTPDVKKGTAVAFAAKSGKVVKATVVGPSMDGDPAKVSVNSGKQNYNISKEKLLDPKTNKPLKVGGAAAGAAGTGKGAAGTGQDAAGTGQDAAGAAGGATIPPDLQKQIDALNPQEKQQLAGLL
jgi:hypothetical protein